MREPRLSELSEAEFEAMIEGHIERMAHGDRELEADVFIDLLLTCGDAGNANPSAGRSIPTDVPGGSMTTLTIELAPDVYALLRAEARQRGQAEQELVAQFLTERLSRARLPTPVVIAPEVQALLSQMSERDMLVPPQGTAADAVRRLEAWNAADGTAEDEEGDGTWEDVLRALDMPRAGYRQLFPDHDRQP